MVEGRGEFEWQMTASVMALQINMNRGKGKPAVKPSELNPFDLAKRTGKKAVLKGKQLSFLKDVFCKSK